MKTYLGELPLVQVHTDSVHPLDWTVKVRLKVPMRTERLRNMSHPAILGVHLDGRIVVDVVSVEKHVSDCGCFLVDLERVTGQDDAFGNDTCGVGREGCAHGD